jgi:hypothetical protein
MRPTEFMIKAWLAQLSRQTGQRLTWDRRDGVEMIRSNGEPIGTLTSIAAVEIFLSGFERGLAVGDLEQLRRAA